jgi:hypothetical protein
MVASDNDDDDADDNQPPPPPSPPMATSFKLFRDDQRLTLCMAHVAQFNISDIAFPPATDGDTSSAPAAISSAQLIDPATMSPSQDIAQVKKRCRLLRIALFQRPTNLCPYIKDTHREDIEPEGPVITIHRAPMLVVEPSACLTGQEGLIFHQGTLPKTQPPLTRRTLRSRYSRTWWLHLRSITLAVLIHACTVLTTSPASMTTPGTCDFITTTPAWTTGAEGGRLRNRKH